jgi:hypothetical protein
MARLHHNAPSIFGVPALARSGPLVEIKFRAVIGRTAN